MSDLQEKSNEGVYRGRFAPSPTGPLHFGSLVAAVGSYLCAKAAGGRWLVRIEDIDPPREAPGAAHDILRTLEVYGFEWDEEVMFQSRRIAAYEAALDRLRERGALYACGCTRKEIADSSTRGIDGPVYPGTCRLDRAGRCTRCALRVRTDDAGVIEFADARLGPQRCAIEREIGDFVVRRADGLFAYQLACVADDAAQGITEVVRGEDLLLSTPRQIHLQRLLGVPTPAYRHLPLALNLAGEKLSKQNLAPAIAHDDPRSTLVHAFAFLGLRGLDIGDCSLASLWEAATALWKCRSVRQEAGVVNAENYRSQPR